jgi:hypothetical protein
MINTSTADVETSAIRELKAIPGVGRAIASYLIELDILHISDLKGKDPEVLYSRFCVMKGCKIDRCLLYVFRCAVHFAGTPDPDPEKLKWWNWKD